MLEVLRGIPVLFVRLICSGRQPDNVYKTNRRASCTSVARRLVLRWGESGWKNVPSVRSYRIPTAGERSPPRQFSYVSFRGSGRLAFQHLRYHLLLSCNAIPVGPRPSHRCYPVRRRSICHRLAARSRSLGLCRFPSHFFLRSTGVRLAHVAIRFSYLRKFGSVESTSPILFSTDLPSIFNWLICHSDMAKDGLRRQGCRDGHSPRSVPVLPDELKALVRRNALKLGHDRFPYRVGTARIRSWAGFSRRARIVKAEPVAHLECSAKNPLGPF